MINNIDSFRCMEDEGKLQILIATHYGGDVGNYIEYDPKTKLWELYEFDCSEPRLYHTHEDPVQLIAISQKELT